MRKQPTEGKITGDVHKSCCRRACHGINANGRDLVLDSTVADPNRCMVESKR